MLALTKDETVQEVWLDVGPRWPTPPAGEADLGSFGVQLLRQSRVLRISSPGPPPTMAQLAALSDPLAETASLGTPIQDSDAGVDIFCRPGVTDAEGETAQQALALAGVLGAHCSAGRRFLFAGSVPIEQRDAVARLLGNPLIHQFHWHNEPEPAVEPGSGAEGVVDLIPLRWASPDTLLTVSREHGLALDLLEMEAIAAYFRAEGREPTDVELQSVALAWSEHCAHKTFKAAIRFRHNGREEIIDSLLGDCLVAPARSLDRDWVRSAFVDNAGILAFDRNHDVSFKVETHNHPSALEPYGGAHTGVGGVIRDILAVSAEPIANTDVLCFGPPDLAESAVPPGVFHPARTFREVVRGVADYGNNMGIPTVGGAVLFHPGYTANPLVFCGTLGLAPTGSHPCDPQPDDLVVLLGGHTGRDGLHGATMSSATLDRDTVAASTVQVGAPITEKVVRDVLPHLRDEHLYHAITDCGAGGLCSAVGEMGEALGVEVDLDRVPLKYHGLRPWEIWLSEAQERIVLAVPRSALDRLEELCRAHSVDVSVIGRFRDDGRLQLRWHGQSAADLALDLLHGGQPARLLSACWDDEVETVDAPNQASDHTADLLALLAHPSIASKETVIRRYDHEVGGATVVKPLVGRGGPSDAAVLRPLPDSWRGVVVAHGINPLYGTRDPHAMAMLAVDEALRNLVAVGGPIDRVALLDNFCWGDVDDAENLGSLVRAAQGCRDAALRYGVPFISGKDSLRNTSVDGQGKHSIPGTLLISALGVMPDVRRSVTMDLKGSGNRIFLLGCTADELGGSHLFALRQSTGGAIPQVRPAETRRLLRRLTRAIGQGLVLSCHDLSEGGLAVAAAEMALAGGLGIELELDHMPRETERSEALLFAESAGRLLVEVAPEYAERFLALFGRQPCAKIGETVTSSRFVLRQGGQTLIDLPVEEIERAWKGTAVALTSEAPVNSRSSPEVGKLGVPPVHASRTGRTLGRKPAAMILTAPGINCDREAAEACRLAGAEVEPVHLNQLLAGERHLRDAGLLVLPGGFSYGDHLGAGAMLAAVFRHRLLDDLIAFIAAGRPVLGICNGFQVLCRLGLLGEVALTSNRGGRFECRWVPVRVEPSPCLFLRDLEEMDLPIAHGEGRVVVAHGALAGVLRRAPLRYRENPNGSVADIAGVTNEAGNVFGLMPHPERYLTPYHHPSRHPGSPAGLRFFQNAVRYIREEL